MVTLTVTATGPVTLRQGLLKHLGYEIPRSEIAEVVRILTNADKVVVDRPATEAGLRVLEAGGDFADGVIAFQGRWLGADTFVSFDKKATKLIEAQGDLARLLI
jgi:predicted nucleic-acid-binding protein